MANSDLSALSNSQFDFDTGLLTQSSFDINGVTIFDFDGSVFFRATQIPSSRVYPIESRYWHYGVEKRDYIYPIE
ncbi:hypothetical protein C8R30_101141 [Nitrosomonas nitrosa]|uniref:hypothetical protein n=1 Tax=Nitrosomonas nitrosa TaxID=52442 RepID=UPI000D4477D5|nr:hypothetical protein [Nitrosomonas nitrosa]PTR04944.1 hypothetical protein C8R30_101141 [Nitrosomonas nitrosa]